MEIITNVVQQAGWLDESPDGIDLFDITPFTVCDKTLPMFWNL